MFRWDENSVISKHKALKCAEGEKMVQLFAFLGWILSLGFIIFGIDSAFFNAGDTVGKIIGHHSIIYFGMSALVGMLWLYIAQQLYKKTRQQ